MAELPERKRARMTKEESYARGVAMEEETQQKTPTAMEKQAGSELAIGTRALTRKQQREAISFVRVLASYGCAGIDQEPDDPKLCGKCSPW